MPSRRGIELPEEGPSVLARAYSLVCWSLLVAACFALVGACGRSTIDDYVTLDGGPTPIEGGPDVHTDGPTSCNASTCPTGCCDANGLCEIGRSVTACGRFGQACEDCAAEGFQTCDVSTQTCGNVLTKCGAQNCPGCCEGNTCLIGRDPNECGQFGNVCQHCASEGLACQGSSCAPPSCGPQNCQGCCFGDQCLTGTDPSACGTFGQQCTNCLGQGETCAPAGSGGACVQQTCGPQNCSGCCMGNTCMKGLDLTACGTNGQQCFNCANVGEQCVFSGTGSGGTCSGPNTCGPQNCAGCCAGNTCTSGVNAFACGSFGQACTDCSQPGEACLSQGPGAGGVCAIQPTCGPQNCKGCCEGNVCVSGFDTGACGEFGQQCTNCSSFNQQCVPDQSGPGGMCSSAQTCGPQNCAGCCQGNVCLPGNVGMACGSFGQQCLNCTLPNEVCVPQSGGQGGVCELQQSCNPMTCPNGCCVGNVCAVGTQNNDCGTGGQACQDCAATGQVCTAQKCQPSPPTCDATNCPGCCDANGVCQAGFLDSQCGQSGAACANCTTMGSTCDTGVTPRVCQSQCPAPYASCAPGVTTPVPSVQQGACTAADLTNAAAACGSGATTAGCRSFFQFEMTVRPQCASCLAPFDVDFNSFSGLFECVAPFVGPGCDHNTGCVTDCITQSCAGCDPSTQSGCQSQVRSGQCSQYLNQAQCVFGAFQGAGAFCNPNNYNGNFGQWLQGVGGHYCGP